MKRKAAAERHARAALAGVTLVEVAWRDRSYADGSAIESMFCSCDTTDETDEKCERYWGPGGNTRCDGGIRPGPQLLAARFKAVRS